MNNNINLEYYKVFYVVAKYLNVTNASDVLFVSQPAVTQAIQKLENQLGGKLFFRQRNGVELTEEGKNLYNYIKGSVEALDSAADRFTQYALLEKGNLKIKVGESIGNSFAYELISKYAKKYPNIKIEIAAGRSKENIEKLNTGEADVVFFAFPYDLKKKNIEITKCFESRIVYYTTDEYLDLLGFVPKTIKDLSNAILISPKIESNTRVVIEEFYKEKGIDFNPQYEMTSGPMLKFVKSGCGIGIGYESFVKSEKTIKILEFEEKMPSNIFGVATLNKEACSFATLEFLKMIENN